MWSQSKRPLLHLFRRSWQEQILVDNVYVLKQNGNVYAGFVLQIYTFIGAILRDSGTYFHLKTGPLQLIWLVSSWRRSRFRFRFTVSIEIYMQMRNKERSKEIIIIFSRSFSLIWFLFSCYLFTIVYLINIKMTKITT